MIKPAPFVVRPIAPVIERLESRAYLAVDLIPAFAGALPGTLVAGQKTKTSIAVSVTNTGADNYTGAGGAAKLTIYASSTAAANGGEVAIATVPVHAPIKAGLSRDVLVPLKMIPAALAAGLYYLDARVTQSALPAADVFSSTPITVAAPFVDLQPQIDGIVKRTGNHAQNITCEIFVSNDGDIAAKGSLAVRIAFSYYMSGVDPFLFKTINSAINIASGGMKAIKVAGTIPKSFPTFDYHMVATINGNEKISESNYSNDTQISSSYFYLI